MRLIGLDIGGGMVKGGYFSDKDLLQVFSKRTKAKAGLDSVYGGIKETVSALIESQGKPDGLGVACCGDIHEGVIKQAINVPCLNGFPIKEKLIQEFGLPVFLINDAAGALYGEIQEMEVVGNVTLLTFGSGVGSASLIDGVIHQESPYDFGHFPLVEGGLPCLCGRNGCAEVYLSAKGLSRMASRRYGRPIGCPDLLDDYRNGDPLAKKIVEDYCALLKKLLSQVKKTVGEGLILLGGGLMGAKDVFAPYLSSKDTKGIDFAKLGNRAGIIGASELARKGLSNL